MRDKRLSLGSRTPAQTQCNKLEITQPGFLPSCRPDNWKLKCHKFNKDLELLRFYILWNKNFVAVHGLNLRLIPCRETQYTMKARMKEWVATEGCQVFRKCSTCILGYFCHVVRTAENVDCLLASLPELHSCWIPMGPRCRPKDFYSILLRYFSLTKNKHLK